MGPLKTDELAPEAYLILIFYRDEQEFSGLRFSRNDLYPPIVFTASPDGAFRRQPPLPVRLRGVGIT